MIRINFLNLRGFNLSENYKLCKETNRPSFEEYLAISSFPVVISHLISNSSMKEYLDLIPEAIVRESTLKGILIPIAGVAFYKGIIELIKLGKYSKVKDMLDCLNLGIGSCGVDAGLRKITDLNKIEVPAYLFSKRTSEEDYFGNYFWFRDAEGNIQAIMQVDDSSKKIKYPNYYVLEESDEELKYIRRKAK